MVQVGERVVSRPLLWWFCFKLEGRKTFSTHRSSNDQGVGCKIQRRDGKSIWKLFPDLYSTALTKGVSQVFLMEKHLDFPSGLNRKWLMPLSPRTAVCVE